MSENIFNVKVNDTIQIRSLTSDRVTDALSVVQNSMREECIAQGVGMFDEIGAPEEMELVFKEVIKDGCSLIAIDVVEDRIAAVIFNKIHSPLKDGERDPLADFIEQNIKRQPCLDLINFLDDLESKVNLFERYNVKATVEIFYMGTDSKYQNRGLGTKIFEGALEFFQRLSEGRTTKTSIDSIINNESLIPEVGLGVFASTFSQRVGEKCNFETLVEVRYDEYFCGNRKMSDKINKIHPTAKLMVKKFST